MCFFVPPNRDSESVRHFGSTTAEHLISNDLVAREGVGPRRQPFSVLLYVVV
jgi:hypothetical protein